MKQKCDKCDIKMYETFQLEKSLGVTNGDGLALDKDRNSGNIISHFHTTLHYLVFIHTTWH